MAVALAPATLSTNVPANVVGPANYFSNVFPRKINFRKGGMIVACIGIVMMPWKLIADPSGYIFTWLVGYASLLGPIAGVLMVDYFLVKKQRLEVKELYQTKGIYTYTNGFNLKAIFSFVLGVIPTVPGFLHQIKVIETLPAVFKILYHLGWFVGLPLAGMIYFLLCLGVKVRKNG